MSNPNRRGAMALVSASLCLTLAALFYFTAPAPALTASAPIAVPAAADWGLSFPTEGESPVGNASAEDLAQYGAYYLGDTSQKVLYLTFDCGYENGYTAQILDVLKDHQAPAAFFVVGHMIQSSPDLIRRMVQEGHIVGNHTFHHPDMSAISDQSKFQQELEELEQLYQETTGQTLPRFYRPPQGKYSEENLRQAQALGYRTVAAHPYRSSGWSRPSVYRDFGFDEGYFMYVEDADLTQKMRTQGKAYLVPQYTAIHAWHRAAHRSLKPFLWQLRSLLRYFSKWGFAW